MRLNYSSLPAACEAHPGNVGWQELAEKTYDELYPSGPSRDSAALEHRLRSTSGLSALRIAEEYEAAFGRVALNELILRSIPDGFYAPGLLHKLLLQLPWSDVFTTNYDTLLERARVTVHERRYDLVQTAADIPGRMKPRVVKLHGSFPSHRPFIITEEDYRTYPARFPAFVNLVQQSIMESVLCLIGFSGDDPNFLAWTGWVRDNLRESTPFIYLCGLLDLSPSERLVLNQKKIIPIDLSPIISEQECPDKATRHALALEWFLRNLERGAPPEIRRWPTCEERAFEPASSGVPPIPPRRGAVARESKLFPKKQPVEVGDLIELRKDWAAEREAYPGWIIAPYENREQLWVYTRYWLVSVISQAGSLPPPENLLLWYELNWRLERAMMPLFLDWVEKLVPVVEAYEPFVQSSPTPTDKITPYAPEHAALPWAQIRTSWIELAFALAREAREDQDANRFDRWMQPIKGVIARSPEWEARWHYEQILFSLSRFDLLKVTVALQQWPNVPELPFWEARRAAVMAEIGNLAEAERIAEAVLEKIRSRLQPFVTDYSTLSQEGWVMCLLRCNQPGWPLGERPCKTRSVSRTLGQTGGLRRQSVEGIRIVGASGQRSAAVPTRTARETHHEFDPGRTSVTRHLAAEPPSFKCLPAFALLRLYEEGAVPMRCGQLTLFCEAASNAADWIELYAPLWSLSTRIRADRMEKLKSRFSRVDIASLKPQQVESLYRLLKPPLDQAVSMAWKNLQEASKRPFLPVD